MLPRAQRALDDAVMERPSQTTLPVHRERHKMLPRAQRALDDAVMERQNQTIPPKHKGRHSMLPRAQQRALDDDAESRPGDLERRMIDDFTAAAASLSQRILRLFLALFLRVCAIKRMAMLQRRDSDAMPQRTAGGEPRDSGPAQSKPTLPMDIGRRATLPRAQRAHEDVVDSRPADLERRRIDERTVDSKCAKAAAPGGVANAFRPTEQEEQEEPQLVHCELCTACPCSGAHV